MGNKESTEKPILTNYEKLFGDANFSDFKLIVQTDTNKTEFNVHRYILATHSSVFEAMFRNDMREKQGAVVDIDDVDAVVMHELLRFIYVGKVEKLDELASDLWIAADKYQLDRLKEVCEKKLIEQLSVDSVYEMLCLVDKYGIASLKKATIWYIINNAEKVGANKKFKNSIKMLSSELLAEVTCAALTESYTQMPSSSR